MGQSQLKRKANERLAKEVNSWNSRGDNEIEVFHPDAQKEFDTLAEARDAAAAARKAEQEAAVIASRNRNDRVDAIQSSMHEVTFKNQDIEVPVGRPGRRLLLHLYRPGSTKVLLYINRLLRQELLEDQNG